MPAEPAVVVTPAGESPRLVPRSNPLANGALVVEQVVNSRRQIRMLAINPNGGRLHVNGHAAPRVAVLGEKDALQLANDTVLHVTIFNRPRIHQPPPQLLGKQCPVCRVPFAETAAIYLCPCGVAMHCEADDTDGLQCARLHHACVACERPITLREGFSYWPDLIHD